MPARAFDGEVGVRPARPHTGTTPDGRPLSVVTTYARRGSRMTLRQQEAWSRRADAWVIADDVVDLLAQPGAPDVSEWFGRAAPLVAEIGSGVGDGTVALAETLPDHNILAFEVWLPGVASTLARLERRGLANVRLVAIDAVWCFEHLLGGESLTELWTFFPDPWPKQRHHQRRLVTSAFAALAASRLAPGGLWRLATDSAAYARQMNGTLSAEPLLDGGVTSRWGQRPLTRFERRAEAAGRVAVDLTWRRRAAED